MRWKEDEIVDGKEEVVDDVLGETRVRIERKHQSESESGI
jgi:hypothetical protein